MVHHRRDDAREIATPDFRSGALVLVAGLEAAIGDSRNG